MTVIDSKFLRAGAVAACLVALAGCGSDPAPATDAGTDAGMDAPRLDTGTTPNDTGTPDGSNPDGGVTAQPTPVPVSPMGHDRYFGVAFEPGGGFYAVGVVADGTSAMDDYRTVVAKFTAAGALDTSFGTGGFAMRNLAVGTSGEVARGIVVQPSGKIVVAATVEHAGATDPRDRDIALLRFNTNGMVDMTFGTDGVVLLDLSAGEAVGSGYVADAVWGLSAYPDGRLVVCGAQKRTGGTDSDFAIVRLSADGARDTMFGTNGVAAVDISNRNANPRTATVLGDGSIIGSGYFDDGGVVKPALFKITPAGQVDTTFGSMGVFSTAPLMAVTEAYGAAPQGTSMVTVGYGRNNAMESIDWVSLRVTANGTLDPTYGTNGYTRVDVNGFNDNGRAIAALPGGRMMLVGGGRPTMTEVDAMVLVLGANGQPDTSFGMNGRRLYDLGGNNDFFWGVAVNQAGNRAAVVGTRGFAAVGDAGVAGNDDGVVMVVPINP